jgi:hypothetical protein
MTAGKSPRERTGEQPRTRKARQGENAGRRPQNHLQYPHKSIKKKL